MKYFNANGMAMSQILGLKRSKNIIVKQGKVMCLYREAVHVPNLITQNIQFFIYSIGIIICISLGSIGAKGQERAGITSEGHEIYPFADHRETDTLLKQGFDLDRFPRYRYKINEQVLSKVKIGDMIPEEIWEKPLSVLHKSDTIHTRRLSYYRDKDLLILDAWASWCAPCVESMIKWEKLAKTYPDRIALFGINLDFTYAALPAIKRQDWESVSTYGLDANILNRSFFSSIMASRLIWIYKGRLIAITGTKDYAVKDVVNLINGKEVLIKSVTDETY